jgi:hypothetical protein
MMEVASVIESRVGCPSMRNRLLEMLYDRGRMKVYDDATGHDASGQPTWGWWLKDANGRTEIWISDYHWHGGTLDEEELGETMRHEGTHEELDSPFHNTSFFAHMQTCMPN